MNHKLTVFAALLITLGIIIGTAGCACEPAQSSIPVSVVESSRPADPDALPVSGGAEIESLPYTDPLITAGRKYSGFDYWYGRLAGEAEQELYKQILSTALAGALNTAEISGDMAQERIKLAFEAVRKDYPQLFYMRQTFTVHQTKNSQGAVVSFHVELSYFFTSRSALERAKTAFYTRVNTLLEQVDSVDGDTARQWEIYRIVTQSGVYNYAEAATPGVNLKAHTAGGCLVEGDCVCDGYALAMALLCNYSGLSATVVTGTLENVAHAWNLVELNGRHYYCDPTLDDFEGIWYNGSQALRSPENTEGMAELKTGTSANYFNLTYDEIAKDHVFDDNSFVGSTADRSAVWADGIGVWCDPADDSGFAALTAALKAAKKGGSVIAATPDGDADALAAAVANSGRAILIFSNGAGTRHYLYLL